MLAWPKGRPVVLVWAATVRARAQADFVAWKYLRGPWPAGILAVVVIALLLRYK